MKEEKLFDIVNNIDDDLICEMLEYRPDKEIKGGEYEGELYSPPSAPEKVRKIHYWQYPVAAAAFMLVLVGALFIFNKGNTLPYEEHTGEQEPTPTTTSATEGETTTLYDPYTPVDTNFPYEFTEEDKELQKFLAETADEAEKFSQLYSSGDFGDIRCSIEEDGVILVRFPQMEKALDKQISCHYAILSDELPFKTAVELETSLKQYYSAEIVSQCMVHVAVGEIVPGNAEEYYAVEIRERGYFDDNGFLYAVPSFIELNGRLYWSVSARGGGFTPNWSMAKVISKTDEELIFSFLGYDMYDIKEIRAGLGRLKYEDGWKYDWWYIDNPYEMVDLEEVWGIGTAKSAPLDLIHAVLCEDGHYRIDEAYMTACDDYDLFRQYFFGTWDGTFGFAFIEEQDSLIIDDSLKSFNMTDINKWYIGDFYIIDGKVLLFCSSSQVGGTLFWLDMSDPETLYTALGSFGSKYEWLWADVDGEEPAVAKLQKSYLAPNEPEKGFMSIFKLREISRDYGIDLSLLTDFEFDYYEGDSSYWLSHSYLMSFYPVYLVSQSPDKLEFKTTVSGGYDDIEGEVSYTVERINGEWVRTESVDRIHHIIMPYKTVRIDNKFNVLFTDTYPEFTAPAAGEAQFTKMSTLELMEYYGMLNMAEGIREGTFIEITEGNASHGIYTYPDGTVYDINTFTFKTAKDTVDFGKKFTVTAGRATVFGREYDQNTYPILLSPKYYNEEMDTFFVVREVYGSCIMVSGKPEELKDFDNVRMEEKFHDLHSHNYEDWQGVPCEFNLFMGDVSFCTMQFANLEYDDIGLSPHSVSNRAVDAFLSNDREELSRYLADPGYEALSEGSEDIYHRVRDITCNFSNVTPKDGVYPLTCEIMMNDSETLIYLDLGLTKIGDEWKVKYIYLQG